MCNVRLVHTFGAVPQRGLARRRAEAAGAAGAVAAARASRICNIGIHYRHSDTTSQNPFAAAGLGGESTITAWDIPVGYSLHEGGTLSSIRAQFNRNRAETENLFAFNQNVAGSAGIQGISGDPFDWGAPTVSIAGFQGLRDTSPSMRTDQTTSIGDSIVKSHGTHTVRFGGDFRDIRSDSRSDANARGSFVFTGLYTGVPLGDFLLGLPQQSTFQSGQVDQFRQHTGDFFVQDDWRARASLTVNAGLRWEYYSPVSEADNRLVTLDAPSTFTAAVPVPAGGTSPFSGVLPDSIVRPDRGAFAPRVGIAWKATPTTTVRTGYGINYSASVYQSIAQQLANQPPYAEVNTVLSTLATPAPLESVLANAQPGSTQNTYGVDPNYRLGYVQIWNADVQHDIARIYNVGVGYTGTKGGDLDLLRAPNRTATGLAHSRRAAVHLGIVRRGLDHERAHAALPPASDRRHRGGVRRTRFPSRSTMRPRLAGWAASSRRTIRTWRPSAVSRASISAIASTAMSRTSCRSARRSAGLRAAWRPRFSATGRSTATCSWRPGRRSRRRCWRASATSAAAPTGRCARTITGSRSPSAIRRRRPSSTPPPSRCRRPARSARPGATRSSGPGQPC